MTAAVLLSTLLAPILRVMIAVVLVVAVEALFRRVR